MRTCAACGRQNPAGTQFCVGCGEYLGWAPEEPAAGPAEPSAGRGAAAPGGGPAHRAAARARA
jgi:hypothetical protein